MKKARILYWTFTGLLFFLEGLIPALTSHTEMAKQGISHLGHPDYFRVMLTFFKVAGALVLVMPHFKKEIKEWAYAGFTFTFLSAAISHAVVDGFGAQTVFPIIALGVLAASYFYYHQLQKSFKTKYNEQYHLSMPVV